MYSYQGAGHPRCVMHHIRHGPCARNTPHSNLSRPQPPRPRLRLRSSGQSPVLCMPKREAGKDWSETKRSHALLALASDTRLNQAIDIGSREGEASCHPPAKPRGKKQHSPPIPILHLGGEDGIRPVEAREAPQIGKPYRISSQSAEPKTSAWPCSAPGPLAPRTNHHIVQRHEFGLSLLTGFARALLRTRHQVLVDCTSNVLAGNATPTGQRSRRKAWGWRGGG